MRYRLLLVLAALVVPIGACTDAVAPKTYVTGVAPKFLSVVSGEGQKDTVVHDVSQPIVVKATNGDNRAVAGVVINFAIVGSDTVPYTDAHVYGFIRVPAEITDTSGTAGANVVLGSLAMDTVRVAAFYNDPVTHEPQLVKFIYISALSDTAATAQFAQSSFFVTAGDTTRAGLEVVDRYGNPSNDPVNWQSSNEEVATVDDSGIVHGVAPGIVSITAQVRQANATAEVHVASPYDAGSIIYVRRNNDNHGWLYTLKTPLRGAISDTSIYEDGDVSSPRLSPNRTRIAFLDSSGFIMISDSLGGGLHALGGGQSFSSISWSPSGSRIAGTSGGKIFVLSAVDGSIKSSCGLSVEQDWVDWSPNGDKFLFADEDNIFVADTACASATQLTSLGKNFHPRWSPNGDKVVFVSTRNVSDDVLVPGGAGHVFVMNADGSGQTSLWSAGAAAYPSYSPQGNFIVFSGNVGPGTLWGGDSQFGFRLYVMQADGSLPLKVLEPRDLYVACWKIDWR